MPSVRQVDNQLVEQGLQKRRQLKRIESSVDWKLNRILAWHSELRYYLSLLKIHILLLFKRRGIYYFTFFNFKVVDSRFKSFKNLLFSINLN